MNTALLLFAFVATFCLVGLLARVGPSLGLIDPPNLRSSHSHRCVRGGGIAFVIVSTLGFFLATPAGAIHNFMPVILGALIVAAVGLWDDLHGISPLKRIFIQTIAAIFGTIPLWQMTAIKLGVHLLVFGIAFLPLAIIAIVWSTNLFNFMDGTDGLAAIESISIFSCASLMFAASGAQELSLCCGLIVATVGGFLLWNFPRAKIFMGDVGSGFLGFLIPTLALLGEATAGVPAVLWLILYAVFVTDTAFTLIRRTMRGEKFYQAHRLHAYQRLHHGARLSHLQVMTISFLLNSVLLVFAWMGFLDNSRIGWLFGLAYIVCAIYYWAVEQIAPMYPETKTQVSVSHQ